MFCSVCENSECCPWKKKSLCKNHLRSLIKRARRLRRFEYAETQRIYRLKNRGMLRKRRIDYCKKYYKKHPYLVTLRNVRHRCNNKNDKKFKYYGGRGIKCFLSVSDIREVWFRDNAHRLKQPSIDRIDGDGHYDKNNIRFVEMSENRKRNIRCRCKTNWNCPSNFSICRVHKKYPVRTT